MTDLCAHCGIGPGSHFFMAAGGPEGYACSAKCASAALSAVAAGDRAGGRRAAKRGSIQTIPPNAHEEYAQALSALAAAERHVKAMSEAAARYRKAAIRWHAVAEKRHEIIKAKDLYIEQLRAQVASLRSESAPAATAQQVPCDACGAPMGCRRSTKRYCSAACRVRAYRQRAEAKKKAT